MRFRVAFWTSALSYTSALLLDEHSFTSPGELFFGAAMGAILGFAFASVIAQRDAQRERRKRFGATYAGGKALSDRASAH